MPVRRTEFTPMLNQYSFADFIDQPLGSCSQNCTDSKQETSPKPRWTLSVEMTLVVIDIQGPLALQIDLNFKLQISRTHINPAALNTALMAS